MPTGRDSLSPQTAGEVTDLDVQGDQVGKRDVRRQSGSRLEAGNTEPSRLLNAQQLAEYLSVSIAWVRKGVLERTLPYTKIGRNVRFTPAQVEQMVKAGGDLPGPSCRQRGGCIQLGCQTASGTTFASVGAALASMARAIARAMAGS